MERNILSFAEFQAIHFYQCEQSGLDHGALERFAEREAGLVTRVSGQDDDIRQHLAECSSCMTYFQKNLNLGENFLERSKYMEDK